MERIALDNLSYEDLLNTWTSLLSSDYDVLIFCLYALGYTQHEIADVCQCRKQNIQYKIGYYRKIYRKKIISKSQ